MKDHDDLIDWYIQREVKATKKHAEHARVFFDRILDNPQEEVDAIKMSLRKNLLDATQDLNRVPTINYKTFPIDLVVAYRNYFLGID